MSKAQEDITFAINKMKEDQMKERISQKVWKEGEKERRISNLRGLAYHIRTKEKFRTKVEVKTHEVHLYIRKDNSKAWRKFDTTIDLPWTAIQRKMRYVMREEEWMCINCGMMNYKDRRTCIQCKAFNDDADKTDDWYCPNDSCARTNYGNRMSCHKCSTARKESQESFGMEESGYNMDLRLQLRNLNYLTTEEDVKQFFLPLELEQIVVCKGLSDKPNGRMNVYFKSRPDAEQALFSKNNSMLDGRVIKLHLAEISKIDPDMCAPDEEFSLEEEIPESEESKNFKWNKMMKAILTRAPDNELSMTNMCKKLFAVFKKLNPETETNRKGFTEMLSEKLKDNEKILLDGDVIKLK